MKILGISALSHDAAVTLIDEDTILFAGHAERYSRIKNDPHLNNELINEALSYGRPDKIVWYEKPYSKKLRQFIYGEYSQVFDVFNIKKYIRQFGLRGIPIEFQEHHKSHAAAGYYTSPFEDATIIVLDGIGEWITSSIWKADGINLESKEQSYYPNSVGLFYTAITDWCGLKPNEDEYILMGMAAYGKPKYTNIMYRDLVTIKDNKFRCKDNFHIGLDWWMKNLSHEARFDIAASAQKIVEDYILSLVEYASLTYKSKNLVLMGGVALNCVSNTLVCNSKHYKKVWIMPNPGDAGSSLGAAVLGNPQKLNWTDPYLGTDIQGDLPIHKIVDDLVEGKVVGIAHGRTEFGPRALGNRSLLANPMLADTKDKVNKIKRRQEFRPFSPSVLSVYAPEYFDVVDQNSEYMQFAVHCFKSVDYPGIVHVDKSSRIQIVYYNVNPQFSNILNQFYIRTGCPMLLNTSLNIKGQPIVNNREDAKQFEMLYDIKVYKGGDSA